MDFSQVMISYAKEGIFLALFLYLWIKYIPDMKKEFKQDLENMDKKHQSEIDRIDKKHDDQVKKMESRETELIAILKSYGDRYSIISDKIDEVLKKLQ